MKFVAVMVFAGGLVALLLGLIGIVRPITILRMPTRKRAAGWVVIGFTAMILAVIVGPSETEKQRAGGQQELGQRREAAVQKCLQDGKYASQADCISKVSDAFELRRHGMSDALDKFQQCAKDGSGCPDANSFDLPYSCQTAFEAAGVALYFTDSIDRKRKWAEVKPTECIDEMELWKLQAKPVFNALERAANRP